jgi:MFS family permease
MTEPRTPTEARWLTPGVRGIGAASFLADVGHEIPTAQLPNLLTATLGAPAAALGLIEGIADGLAGAARLAGGAIADDPHRRRSQAVAGYTTTAILSSLIGAATAVWQVAILRAGAWAARGLRVPARNALLADIVPASVYGRAYGFERAMDNLGAIAGPLLALALVGLVGVRTAIALSVIPGLLAALAIVYAIRHAPRAEERERQPLRLRIRPVLTGRLGRLMVGVSAFEFGNVAATLLILRATELLAPGRTQDRATQLALGLYVAYNLAATLASVPAGRLGDRRAPSWSWSSGSPCSGWPMPASPPAPPASSPWPPGSSPPEWRSGAWRRRSMPPWRPWPRSSCGGRRSGCWRRCRASATWPPARLASQRVVPADAKVQVNPAPLPLDLIDLALAVIFAASLEGEQLRVPREGLERYQHVSHCHALRVASQRCL